MDSLLEKLREFDALRDQSGDKGDFVAWRTLETIRPDFDDVAIGALHPFLKQTIRQIGITRLYAHQSKAILAALNGKNVVLEAPPAGGKTLAFALPMFDTLLRNGGSHALMLYPMKALSNDQRFQIDGMARVISDMGTEITSWPYDGDTDREWRSILKKKPPSILLTNPEMLHYSFLGLAETWVSFLRNLKFIVIDEIHEYRGYFGTNFALLLRRFLLVLDRLGSNPQLFLATATCANPLEHARRLTGADFSLVSASSKMRPQRHFAFISPRIPDYCFREIYQKRIARAALACLAKGMSTLVFCPSRTFTEDVFGMARRDAESLDLDPSVIVAYRSGYMPEERRDIEEGMRSGKYQIVFSTNALELGIDIGRLDACILAGFPDSIMSAWQRIGRIGRSWDKTAYILFFAMNNAVDQFYASNIDAFLERPLDEIAVGLDNEELIGKHIPYLLHEQGWNLSSGSDRIIGRTFYEHAKEKMSGSRPIKGGKGPSYQRLDIRGGAGGVWDLTYHGKKIGTMSDVQCFREAYVGAVYNHFGKAFRVASHGAREIVLEDVDPHLRTDGAFYAVVQSSEILDACIYQDQVSAFYGKLVIFENFCGYKLIDARDGSVMDEQSAQMAKPRHAHGFWLMLEDESIMPRAKLVAGIRATEHIIRIGATFVIPSDRHDTATFCSINSPPADYLYETVPGGIGIAEKAFRVWREVLHEGMEIARRCSCKDGCPRCIYPPRLKDAERISKKAGIALGKHILEVSDNEPSDVFDPCTGGWTGKKSGKRRMTASTSG